MKWLLQQAVKRGVPEWVVLCIFYGLLVAFVVVWHLLWIDFGVTQEREKWQLKESAELVKRQQKILDLTVLNRELERKRSLDQSALVQHYQEQINHEKTRTQTLLNDVAAQRKRLSINTKTVRACSHTASGLPAIAERSNTTESAELSDEAAQFLVSLAAEADEVTKQLQLCQALLIETRP